MTDDETGEAPIEARRYVDAVRRNLLPIVGFAFAVAIVVLIVSSLLATRYEAEASIVMQDLTQLDQNASTDPARDLSTAAVFLKTTSVLRAAASRVPGETADSLSGHVRTRVDPNANFIYVTADAANRDRAAAIANAVAQAFVAQHGALERAQAVRERAALLHQAAQLRRTGRAGDAAALGGRISDLGIAIADAGSDFAVAEPATAPASASSPHPLRDAGLGFVLALFIGVLVAVGREQLAPRLTGQRELSGLLGLPVLGTIPTMPRLAVLNGGRPADGAVYRGVAAALARSLPKADSPRVVLVTSAVRGEGKTTATAELARALEAAGHPTLVVAADARAPTLNDQRGVRAAPGLTDLVRARARATLEKQAEALGRALRNAPGGHRLLDVLPSGRTPDEAAHVLADGDVASLLEQIRARDYEYVLVDAPALLGDAELHELMGACDEVLYVAKLDRVTREQTLEARDRLEGHGRRPLGMVVIGRRA